MNKYIVKNKRLSKYLYSLGFDRECCFNDKNEEYWVFQRDELFNEALDFYFYMRNKNREND